MILEHLNTAVQAVFPIFIVILVGYLCRRRNLISEALNAGLSQLVFNIALPAFVYMNILESDFSRMISPVTLTIAVTSIIVSFIVIWAIARLWIRNPRVIGTFVISSTRSNFALIGVPLAGSLFGKPGLSAAALVLSMIIPFQNALSVLAFTLPQQVLSVRQLKIITLAILKNPLILAVIAALITKFFALPMPAVALTTIGYLNQMAPPLSLIAIGSGLHSASLSRHWRSGSISTLTKTVVLPLIWTIIAILLGIRGIELGIIFLLTGSPSAVSIYVMAQSLNGDADLSAVIIMLSTLMTVVSLTFGIFILMATHLM